MPTERRRLVNIIGGSAGNLVEYFDWYVYSAFTLYFASSFFPKEDQTAQLLSGAAVFAVGFVMRPIGAWLMGIYADRHGRKAGLTVSMTMMCVGSLIIAVSPTYAQAGVIAPTLLVIARIIQGLSLGGEYGASATYLSEMAGTKRRGFWSSFQYVTIIAGQLLALVLLVGLQALLGEAALEAWGWRIAFALGGLLAVVAFVIRRRVAETDNFLKLEAKQEARPRSSFSSLFRHHPREALLVIALTAGGTLAFYTYTTYMQKFLANSVGFERVTASRIMTVALALFMVMQPLAGALSDRVGRKPLMIAFGAAGALLTWPIFTALEQARDPLTAFVLVTASLVIVTGYTSINAVVKAELFPGHIRALGVALPYAIANAIFGGSAEYVALSLKSAGHERWFYVYVSMVILVSLVTYATMRETKITSLIDRD
ncbi:MAG: MFS transporter [Sphingomonas bacterium]|nr:MFS transporter [Sphingomonas bacterium]